MCKWWYWRAHAQLPLILADVRFQSFLSSLYLTAISAHLRIVEVVFYLTRSVSIQMRPCRKKENYPIPNLIT
jgi:hypothetical protein